ncbi:MAG: pteridine reductase [Moraxella sp.]|nr:pteridine reductase [Moraxella sp.]
MPITSLDNSHHHAPKTALITGGAKRIGQAIAQALHADGMNVIIHYQHSQADAIQLADKLNALRSHSATTLQADLVLVDSKQQLDTFYHDVLSRFGGIHTLVHNASSFYPTAMRDDFYTLQQAWADLFLTNAKAPFFLSHAFYHELSKSHGTIISLLDIHAQGKPYQGYPIYSMAKAAHQMLVQSLALEFAPNIRVNGIAPGVNVFPDDWTDDDKQPLLNSIPLGRIGTPNDIAMAVCFLNKAHHITGQILAVDGGRGLTLKGM